MAKVIKLTDNGNVTMLPITDSAYVQHRWLEGLTGGTTITSVRDALNDVIDRVDGLPAPGSDIQHLSGSGTALASATNSSVAYINLSDGGKVGIQGTAGSSAINQAGQAEVIVAYDTASGQPNNIRIKVSYRDTNTDHYDKITKTYTGTNGLKLFKVTTVGTATGSDTGDYYLPIATTSGLGTVKSTTTGTTSGRDYSVQVNADGSMKVNVPWKDYDNLISGAMHMKGGTDKGPASNVTYTDGDTYIYNPSDATVTYTMPAALSINGVAQVLTKGDMFTYSASVKKWTVLENNNEVATTSTLGLVKSTTTGTTANRNYNVEVNSDGTMKVNVPWTDASTTLDGHYSPTTGTAVTQTGSVNVGGTFTEISYVFDTKGHKTAQVTKTWTINAPTTQSVIKSASLTNNMKYAELTSSAPEINETWLQSATGRSSAVASSSYIAVGSLSAPTCTAYVKSTT